jgi:hypothetical protein
MALASRGATPIESLLARYEGVAVLACAPRPTAGDSGSSASAVPPVPVAVPSTAASLLFTALPGVSPAEVHPSGTIYEDGKAYVPLRTKAAVKAAQYARFAGRRIDSSPPAMVSRVMFTPSVARQRLVAAATSVRNFARLATRMSAGAGTATAAAPTVSNTVAASAEAPVVENDGGSASATHREPEPQTAAPTTAPATPKREISERGIPAPASPSVVVPPTTASSGAVLASSAPATPSSKPSRSTAASPMSAASPQHWTGVQYVHKSNVTIFGDIIIQPFERSGGEGEELRRMSPTEALDRVFHAFNDGSATQKSASLALRKLASSAIGLRAKYETGWLYWDETAQEFILEMLREKAVGVARAAVEAQKEVNVGGGVILRFSEIRDVSKRTSTSAGAPPPVVSPPERQAGAIAGAGAGAGGRDEGGQG